MRAAFGKVNTLHNHVLPWTDRPLVAENLVGGEDGIDDKARAELAALERIIRDTSPFQTLDTYIENQKLFDLAFENLRNQNHQRAAELFQRVLEQNPKHVQSYGNLALAQAGLGNKAAALECLDKALALDPSYEPARNNRLAIATMNEGEPHRPLDIAETEYYRERLEAGKSRKSRWWQNLKLWEPG